MSISNPTPTLVSDFDYDLPEELIAQHPPVERGSSRMLVLDRQTGRFTDSLFENLPQILQPGDLLVLNDSRVMPARLYAVRSGDAARFDDATGSGSATRSDDARERSSAEQSAEPATQRPAQPTALIEVLLTEPVEAQAGSPVASPPPNRAQAAENLPPAESPAATENLAPAENLLCAENLWRALVKPGRKVRLGERLFFFERGVFGSGPGETSSSEISSSEGSPAPSRVQPLLTAEVVGVGTFGERTLRFDPVADFHARLDRIGHIPLPPYIRRKQARQPDTAEDRERYQTVYSRTPGSAAAPTAGLHFTPRTLEELAARGVEIQTLTLHVGLGTFQPVRVNRLDEIRLHAERYTLPAATAEALNRALAQGRRIVAAGTTTTRALEHIAAQAHIAAQTHNAAQARTGSQAHSASQAHISGKGAAGPLHLEPHSGSTSLFIAPGHRFRIVNGLLTNFHLPGSTLLMLAAAFAAPADGAGRAAGDAAQATGETQLATGDAGSATGEAVDQGRRRILAAYAHAIDRRYRFYSYGDCMLLL